MKSSVTLFGTKVKIKQVNLDGTGVLGYYQHDKKLIALSHRLKGDELTLTLAHEVIHASVAILGLNQCQLSMDLEEMLCETIPTAMASVFKLSPLKK